MTNFFNELNPIDIDNTSFFNELNPIDNDNIYEKINISGYSYGYKLSEAFFDDIVDSIAMYFFK